jgi:hypothetical protein
MLVQMRFATDDHLVRAFAAQYADHTLDSDILPWRSGWPVALAYRFEGIFRRRVM